MIVLDVTIVSLSTLISGLSYLLVMALHLSLLILAKPSVFIIIIHKDIMNVHVGSVVTSVHGSRYKFSKIITYVHLIIHLEKQHKIMGAAEIFVRGASPKRPPIRTKQAPPHGAKCPHKEKKVAKILPHGK